LRGWEKMNRLEQLNTPQMKQCYPFVQKLSVNSEKESIKVNVQNRQQAMNRHKRVEKFNEEDGSAV
jgi:hypothetical protein